MESNRKISRLTALQVSRAKAPGVYRDGCGLYLQVSPSGTGAWVYRYMLNGVSREMGLGPLHLVSLAEARQRADAARKLRHDGIDPIEARRAERQKASVEAARSVTFTTAAEAYINAHKAGWRSAVHTAQWSSTLATYAYPVFGSLPVPDINVTMILKVLEPIWCTKTETAGRVRQRVEAILDWATARGYRQGDNPARWRGHLQNLLPKPANVQKVRHHPALPFTEVAGFVQKLRVQASMAARALEFLILTATRTSETIGARWCEIDLANRTWTIPGERIKTRRDHRIPLSEPAMRILRELDKARVGEYVFFGLKRSKSLSNMALLALLDRMGRRDITAHGFRSTFRDWAAECTDFPRDVAEMALAHAITNKVEAAYRRGDLLEKRRPLMEQWAAHCTKTPEVIQIRAAA